MSRPTAFTFTDVRTLRKMLKGLPGATPITVRVCGIHRNPPPRIIAAGVGRIEELGTTLDALHIDVQLGVER